MKGDKQGFPKPKAGSNRAIQSTSVHYPLEQNKFIIEKQQIKGHINYSTLTLEQLKNEAKQLKRELSQKQLQVLNMDKIFRIENFKNQNYKSKVIDAEKYCQQVRISLTKRLINKYKDNKDTPLFYNQNGLSPFQLMLLNYSKNQFGQQIICMICFLDIENNSHIVKLPCSHILHRQCGTQHLLYSKQCPGCSQDIDISFETNKI